MSDSHGEAPFHTLVRTRRTIHKYRPEPVDQTAVDRALEAAHWAPNHKLTWPWRFTRVGPEVRASITELAVRVKEEKVSLSEHQRAGVVAKVSNPAVLIVASVVRSQDAFQGREDYAATSCAIQNLMLSLHADGIGSKWGTGAVTRRPETYRLLGIDESAEEIIGFLWVGVPEVVPAIERPDISLHVRDTP